MVGRPVAASCSSILRPCAAASGLSPRCSGSYDVAFELSRQIGWSNRPLLCAGALLFSVTEYIDRV